MGINEPLRREDVDTVAKMNLCLDYDVLIIGGGLSGMYSLHKMRQLGLKSRLLEAGSGEGGTWFWNTYPGARFDSESYSYIFSFDKTLLDEWKWTEHFAGQKETLEYCQYFAKKFKLNDDMQFNTRVSSAWWCEGSSSWQLTDATGKTYTSRFMITAMGVLNEPTLPNIPGLNSFRGAGFHTSRWPKNGHDVIKGKRVGIIGTGATAIQIIQEIKQLVGSLTVFQRTPNWTAPLRNKRISQEDMDEIRRSYPAIFQKCRESYSGFIHQADKRSVFDVSEEERENYWEDLYAQAGFSKWLANFRDINTNKASNELFSKFIATKIRERVHDPEIAEKLVPKNHGFGTRRVPLEGGYYEAFNQSNVVLVDVNENPIESVYEKGIKTNEKDFEFDVIIYATGFDAITGSFSKVDIRGIGGRKLTEKWADGIKTFLGLTVDGFPNMFMIMGPHQMFGNIPRSIEYAVGWVADFIEYAVSNKIVVVEATKEGREAWTLHVQECAVGVLGNEVDSWMTGVNTNVAGKQKRSIVRYNGSGPGFREKCDDVKVRGYTEFRLVPRP